MQKMDPIIQTSSPMQTALVRPLFSETKSPPMSDNSI